MRALLTRVRSRLAILYGRACSAAWAFTVGINGASPEWSDPTAFDSNGRAGYAGALTAGKFDMPLEYGQTPWDDMTKEELLLEVKRLYSATSSLYGSLRMCADMSRSEPYFHQRGGRGFRALSKGEQALAAANRSHHSDQVHAAYFRYADDLLFSGVGDGWLIDSQGRMGAISIEHAAQYDGSEASVAGMRGMQGIIHKITWDDLKPKS